jgi:hypothetical protein
MKTKTHYRSGVFLKNENPVEEQEALEIWFAGAGEWSQVAFWEMAQISLARG